MGQVLNSRANLILEEREVKLWNKEAVRQWMEDQGFGRHRDAFYKQNIDGRKLISLTETDLQKLGIDNEIAKKIFERIEVMKEEISDEVDEEREQEKIKLVIKKLEKLRGLQNLAEDQKIDKAKNLVVKQSLLDSYLNKNFVATTKTLTGLLEEPAASKQTNRESVNYSSTFSSIAETNIQDLAADEEETKNMKRLRKEIEQIANFDTRMNNNESSSKFTDEEYMRVKLVIVEIHQNNTQRTFRKVLSPIMEAFDISPQFGLFHSALIVGPWYLEWNDSSLIVPRKCYSGAAVLAADIETKFQGALQVNDALDKISDIICHWNASFTYSQKDRNCQTFVDEICDSLGIELKFGGSLAEYVSHLRRNGKCELKYYLTPDLQKTLGINESSISFKTHKELDDFVRKLDEKAPTHLDIVAPDDKVLLKSFDRAFWLRHFKNKSDESWTPERVDSKTYDTSCPFGHPHQTKSMVENFFVKKKSK